jgi:hypothetical protein
MHPIMRLYEDVLAGDSAAANLPALPRMIFIVHGTVAVDGRELHDGEVWQGEGASTLAPGRTGATCWRFELA